jgi:hypothetical protein
MTTRKNFLSFTKSQSLTRTMCIAMPGASFLKTFLAAGKTENGTTGNVVTAELGKTCQSQATNLPNGNVVLLAAKNGKGR